MSEDGHANSPLIGAAELSARLADDPRLVLLDVRWVLGRADGRERFAQQHIPGAQYVDLDRELASPPSPERGRHPLPSREAFQDVLRFHGVSVDSAIVVYDQSQSFGASRLWWLLQNAGLDSRVLDGGLAAWQRTALPVESGEGAVVAPSAVDIRWDQSPTMTIEDAGAFPNAGILLDARAGERYRGETEPIDPRAGHIPGALSAPTTDNLDADGRFLSQARLRSRFGAVGIEEATAVGSYCGSGITATHQLLALEVAGLHGVLFPGSWSQWSNDLSLPIAVGPDPRGR
jgi:thiosulfate/3-mercaptopyruvate sulfurtransferase